jgi:hypothetical protein
MYRVRDGREWKVWPRGIDIDTDEMARKEIKRKKH